MQAAEIIRQARQRAGLSKRALARRAHTSPAALVEYESGRRDPSVSSLERIVAAAGFDVVFGIRGPTDPDPAEAGRRLVEVLELAEHLPRRAPATRMAFPIFGP